MRWKKSSGRNWKSTTWPQTRRLQMSQMTTYSNWAQKKVQLYGVCHSVCGGSCTDVMCALKVLMKEYREGHCFFVELEKPYDWVLREVWQCMRTKINVSFLTVPSGNQWVPDSTKLPWSDGETEALLDIWGSEEIQENLKGSAKNKQIFLQISQVMTSQGYLRTPEQCQSRIKRLRANFRHFLEGRK